ncbi:MAG: FAD-dependent oxidoreductase [Clostridia bacterium]|nr:FAD-dependent oxidoreductase [Clostridia bacterium]
MADFPSWQQGVRHEYPPLRGPHRADAVVAGGGLAGILTAWRLQSQGLEVILLEADRLGRGATFGCSGLCSCQAMQGYLRAAEACGMEAARTYAQLLRESAQGLADLIHRLHLPCQLTECSVYAYAETEDDLPALQHLLKLEQQLGLNLSPAPDAGGCPFPVELSAVMHRQYLLHPLPMLLALAQEAGRLGCRIYEHTPLQAIEGRAVRTPEGSVRTEAILLCTGIPPDCRSASVLSLVEPRLREARVLHGTAALHTAQRSVQGDEFAMRPLPEGLLITLDRGAYGTRDTARSALLRDRALRALLPDYDTADVILRRELHTRDGLPLIGPVEPSRSQVLMAGCFGGMGLAGSCLAAELLTASVLAKPMSESSLFLPFRLQGQRRVFAASALRRSIRRWKRRSAPRCPHMGCPLRYNPGNRQWECPCHGSGFDLFGQPLSAPAVRSAVLSPRDRPDA